MPYIADAARKYIKKYANDASTDVDIKDIDPLYGPICTFKVNDLKNFMIMKSYFADNDTTLAHYKNKPSNVYVLYPCDDSRWLEALKEMNIISNLKTLYDD